MSRRQLALGVFAIIVFVTDVIVGAEPYQPYVNPYPLEAYRNHPYFPQQYQPVWTSPGSPRYFRPGYGYAIPGFGNGSMMSPSQTPSIRYDSFRPITGYQFQGLAPRPLDRGISPWQIPNGPTSILSSPVF